MARILSHPMRWLNIAVETLQKVEFVHAEPAEVGCWLRLLAFCASQENGGLIEDCHEWKDRQWTIAAGILRADVHQPAKLWKWTKGALRVLHYPLEKEREVAAKRAGGKKGSKVRWNLGKVKKGPPEKASKNGSLDDSATSLPDSSPICGKEREWNGKERARDHRRAKPDDQPLESRDPRS